MWQLQSVIRIGLLICIIRKTQSCYDIVEKGKTTEFYCPLPNNSTVITWQAITANNISLNLTTCNMATSVCTDQQPSVYQGWVLRSFQGNNTMRLNIKSARINETLFRCVNDGGAILEECELEVYVWPTPPVCEPVKLDRESLFLELTCSSSNVYPEFSARLNWTGPPGSALEVDRNNSVCSISDLGTGSQGDVSETCTWRIPASNMPEGVYYLSIKVTAFVTNYTTLTKSAVGSQNITADLRLPRITIFNRRCPVGPGVVGQGYIKVGTSATCTCEVEEVGLLGGQAQWFDADGRSVGVDNSSDRSSNLTLSYNPSDPDVTYECRAINPTSTYYFVTYKPKFPSPDCHATVEKGQSTHIECPVQGSINSLTWQVWTGKEYVNLSTCPLAGACVDHMSQVYNGHILNSSGVPKFTLDINSVRSNETQFRCLTDDGNVFKICTLEPYRWLSTPTYEGMRIIHQSVEVTYSTVVFPNLEAVLRRRETFLSKDDVDSSYCRLNYSSSEPNSDYIATCTWRIPFTKMLLSNTFYVEMSLLVTNQTLVNLSHVVSNDNVIQLGPVTVSLNNCPAGPGMRGDKIRIGTSATCTCTAASSRFFFFSAQARWFTTDEQVVGVEDSGHGSSTLTVSFNSSDPSPTYECRGINPTREYPYITYQPKFSSSSHGCAITWMMFLLVVCTCLSPTLN